MPIYDARCKRIEGFPHQDEPLPGAVPFPEGHRHMVDANGQRVGIILWCNTETGELERYMRQPNGKFLTDAATGRVQTFLETHPAPLRSVGETDEADAKQLLNYTENMGLLCFESSGVSEGK